MLIIQTGVIPSNIIGKQLFELKKNSLTEFKIFWNLQGHTPLSLHYLRWYRFWQHNVSIAHMNINSEYCKLALKLSTYTQFKITHHFFFQNLRHMHSPIPAPNPSLMSLSPHHPANEERSFLFGGIYKQIFLIDREVCNKCNTHQLYNLISTIKIQFSIMTMECRL